MNIKKQLIYPVIIISIINISRVHTSVMVENTVHEYQHIRANNHDFVMKHTINVSNDIFEWLVDSKSVPGNVYQDELLLAEREDRKKELDAQRLQSEAKAKEFRQARYRAMHKLLSCALENIQREKSKIDHYELTGFLVWSDKTIASQESYDAIISHTIPETHVLLESLETKELSMLKELLSQLEDYGQRFCQLFMDTVNHVISHTRDTSVLKRLIDLT